jgi:hypothetical protein
MADGRQVQEDIVGDAALRCRRLAVMDMPDRIIELRLRLFLRVFGQEGDIFVHRARDHVEIETLGRLRLLIHE